MRGFQKGITLDCRTSLAVTESCVVVGGWLYDNSVSKVQVLLDLKTLDLTLDFDFRLWTWTFA